MRVAGSAWLVCAAILAGTACSSDREPQPQASRPAAGAATVGDSVIPPAGGEPEVAPIDPDRIRQGSNTLSSGMPRTQLVSRGRELWRDSSLSETGEIACVTCHGDDYALMQASFATPYPHRVGMVVQRTGIERVNAAEMVQMCMVVPMGSEPLPWDSPELAALAAYVTDIQGRFPGAGAASPDDAPAAEPNPRDAR